MSTMKSAQAPRPAEPAPTAQEPADSRDWLTLVFWVICASVLAWLLLKDLFRALLRL